MPFLDPKKRTTAVHPVRIKVANGVRTELDQVFKLPIFFGKDRTDPVAFYVMPNLPFDLLIGNPTLERWDAKLAWGNHSFSFRPNAAQERRIEVGWSTFTGQHWRRPIPLMCAEEIILKAGTQTAVPISKVKDEEWEGLSGCSGLITPCRTRQVLTTKFSTSYGIADTAPAFVMVANVTNQPIKLKQGFVVAEYHQRPKDTFQARRRQRLSAGESSVPGPSGPAEQKAPTSVGCNPSAGSLPSHGGGRSQNVDLGSEQSSASSSSPVSGNICHSPRGCCDGRIRLPTGHRPCAEVCGEASANSCLHCNPSLTDPKGMHGTCRLCGKGDGDCHPGQKKGVPGGSVPIEGNVCGVNREADLDWSLFEKEPLKSVNLSELKEQRTPEEVRELAKILIEFKDLLSDGSLDFKSNPNVKHKTTAIIETTVHNPRILARTHGCNPEETEEFRKVIEQKVAEGVIEPSHAQWCSNALLVRKDGKIRMVIDYRSLTRLL